MAGVRVLETCAIENRGVDELRAMLVDRTSVFYGASGAGKSSLLNAIQPELAIRVGKISKYWDTGKHTTTFSQLHRMDLGGWVIDTPGIRVFRLHALTPGELRGLFPEFARFSGKCRFPDCSHDHEPGCAVFPAVEAGQLPATRYASYVEMLDELGPQATPDVEPESDGSEEG